MPSLLLSPCFAGSYVEPTMKSLQFTHAIACLSLATQLAIGQTPVLDAMGNPVDQDGKRIELPEATLPKLNWDRKSILPKGKAANFIRQANNRNAFQEKRARAIFSLFAHHIKPGQTTDQLPQAMSKADWLQDSILRPLGGMGGWVPVGLGFADSVFYIYVLPIETKEIWSPWVIYFRFEGKTDLEDAKRFLRRDPADRKIRLLEYALCFAQTKGDRGTRRTERYSKKGMHVYE